MYNYNKMNKVKITDLFGMKINNDSHIVILEISKNNIKSYLTPFSQYNGIQICRLKRDSLEPVFRAYGLNIEEYHSFGDNLLHDQEYYKIVMCNKNKSRTTNRYRILDVINGIYIWQPLSDDDNYTHLGVVCSVDANVPDIETCLIEKELCKIFPMEGQQANLFTGDYNLINHIEDGKRKLITGTLLTRKTNELVDRWNNYKGNQVMLFSEQRPWYKERQVTIPIAPITSDNYFSENIIPNTAPYKSNTILNMTHPSLGMGYSYASRRNVEKFEENDSQMNNHNDYILLVLFIVIFILFVYKVYKK